MKRILSVVKRPFILCLLAFSASLVWLPLWMVLTGSLSGAVEIKESIGPVLNGEDALAYWHLLPQYPTLKNFVELFLDSPSFFHMFWNSVIQVVPALLGQLLVAVPAAWAFARFEFFSKKLLFSIYMIVMLMPFQVTMVSTYLVLDRLKLMNTHFAMILPALFSAFPVFIMVKFFSSIPKALIEAAKMDGASEWRIFLFIGVPLGAPGIISAMALGFLEYWNAMEQPLTFLSDQTLWPLSLYLPNIAAEEAGMSFVASIVMMAPAILIFLFGQKYLEDGIRAAGLKE